MFFKFNRLLLRHIIETLVKRVKLRLYLVMLRASVRYDEPSVVPT